MDKILFTKINSLLLDTLTNKISWSGSPVGFITNETARKYYDDNILNIKEAYYNYDSNEVIIINTNNTCTLFFKLEFDKIYQFDNFKIGEGHLLYILVKAIQQQIGLENKISDLIDTVNFYKEASDNADDYYSDKEYIDELWERINKLEDKLQKKILPIKNWKNNTIFYLNKQTSKNYNLQILKVH